MRDNNGYLNGIGYTVIGTIIILGIIAIIGLGMWLIPRYGVWQKQLKGEAQLREAEYSKQVQIEEAKANLEAEKLNAQAEVERAKGMAEGRAEGRAEGIMDTAKRMKAHGMEPTVIAVMTGLSIEDINVL